MFQFNNGHTLSAQSAKGFLMTRQACMQYEDLKVETYRASEDLRDGSHAVRITHVPTGIIVSSENEKSYELNREKAMELLRLQLGKFE